MSYKILNEELKRADDVSAYAYEKNILERLIKFPLSKKIKFEIKTSLSNVYFKLSQHKSSINMIDSLLKETKQSNTISDLLMLKAKCLIGLTEYSEGKKIIESLLPNIDDINKKQQLMLEIATVDFNLNEYDQAFNTCWQIIGEKNTAYEEKGLTYQMLGLLSIYKNNNLDEAFNFFGKGEAAYKAGNLNFRIAEMEMNLGNIFNIKGDREKAKSYWDKSLKITRSTGNIEQEAKLLMNYGIYYYEILELDKSINSYEKALSILTSLGSKKEYGFLLINLSELYFLTCEYQKAFEYINIAINTFKQLNNLAEELEAVFLLGKLNFIIGDYESLNLILEKLIIYMENNKLSEKFKNYFHILMISYNLTKKVATDYSDQLNIIRKFTLNEKNEYDYFFCTMLLVKNLIKLNKFSNAYNILISDELIKICDENIMFEAERNYMIGIVINLDSSLDSKSQLDYFNRAYNNISSTHITELTWKVLFALTIIYYNRGNLKKARGFGKYALSLINFNAENIKDYRLRNIYLEEKERKEALDRLNSF